MSTKKIRSAGDGCLLIPLVVVAGYWVRISSFPAARLALSADRRCTLEFHRWYSGRCVLSCYEHGSCVGTTRLSSGWLTDPIAFFPGPDENTVLCFSWGDTTDAAFTVDFTERHRSGAAIPKRLADVVDWSAFGVRACTRREVDFTAHYLKTVDQQELAHRSRMDSGSAQVRADLLKFLLWATGERDYQDPILKDAIPQLLPEG